MNAWTFVHRHLTYMLTRFPITVSWSARLVRLTLMLTPQIEHAKPPAFLIYSNTVAVVLSYALKVTMLIYWETA